MSNKLDLNTEKQTNQLKNMQISVDEMEKSLDFQMKRYDQEKAELEKNDEICKKSDEMEERLSQAIEVERKKT